MIHRILYVVCFMLFLSFITQDRSWGKETFKIKHITTSHPVIALTFDDGPHKDYTPYILEILKQHHIKATFFCIGNKVNHFSSIIKQIVDNGHEIGNHSYTHKEHKHLSEEKKYHELVKSQRAFYKATHTFPIFYRPPYGVVEENDETFYSKYFYKTILWSIDSKDWQTDILPSQIIKNVVTKLKNGSIILCHDTSKKTLFILPTLIKIAQRKGFQFVTISKLLYYNQSQN